MKKQSFYVPCCALCEWALASKEEDGTLLCHKKKRTVEDTDCCRKFRFDLLKYSPAKQREIPTLDPTMLEI